jgi:hypothetical protein
MADKGGADPGRDASDHLRTTLSTAGGGTFFAFYINQGLASNCYDV